MSEANCRKKLEMEGKPYPRTCPECGLGGPCKYFAVQGIVKQPSCAYVAYQDYGTEGCSKPLGVFSTKDKAALWLFEQKLFNTAIEELPMDFATH